MDPTANIGSAKTRNTVTSHGGSVDAEDKQKSQCALAQYDHAVAEYLLTSTTRRSKYNSGRLIDYGFLSSSYLNTERDVGKLGAEVPREPAQLSISIGSPSLACAVQPLVPRAVAAGAHYRCGGVPASGAGKCQLSLHTRIITEFNLLKNKEISAWLANCIV